MSVLSFPRVYFNGYMEWDVCTANNNDYAPTYAQADAALNWDFLAQNGITRENFKTAFPPFVISPHDDTCPNFTSGGSTSTTPDSCCGSYKKHMLSRWNFYGSGGCSTVQYQDKVTVVTGGAAAYGENASSDPLIDQPIVITGTQGTQARLVDINPGSPWCSQIFFQQIFIGDPTSDLFIGGAPSMRMYSRAFFAPRAPFASDLIIAGPVGVIFQCTVPKSAIQSKNGPNSQLLQSLLNAAQNAEGLMIRFTAYSTQYYQNGIFNDLEAFADCDALYAGYQAGYTGSNPAYSRITGTFGVWNAGELSTAPQGHFLTPQTTLPVPTGTTAETYLEPMAKDSRPVPVPRAAAGGAPQFPFGAIFAEIDTAANIVSLDMSNAILEADSNASRYDYGPIEVGIVSGTSFSTIGTIQPPQYLQSGFFATSGLVDVPLTATPGDGLLGLRVNGNVLASLEQEYTAETDDRGIYIDQCNSEPVVVQVRYRNGLPPQGTRIKLGQYFPWLLKLGSSWFQLFGTTPQGSGDPAKICSELPDGEYVTFDGADGHDTVPVGADGYARFSLSSKAPGFPVVAFFPYNGQLSPALPGSIQFGFANPHTPQIGTAFFTTARVMAFDNDVPAQFCALWNSGYDQNAAWNFIYNEILYLYDMLFPVMRPIIDLGSQSAVEQRIGGILDKTAAGKVDRDTLYMPVTRDLSAGKRLTLEAWGGLVLKKFPKEPIGPIVVPCD